MIKYFVHWAELSSGTPLYDVASSGSDYVAVGEKGTIIHSNDGRYGKKVIKQRKLS